MEQLTNGSDMLNIGVNNLSINGSAAFVGGGSITGVTSIDGVPWPPSFGMGAFASVIYNSAATPSGNIVNTWAAVAEFVNNCNGACVVYIDNSTVSPQVTSAITINFQGEGGLDSAQSQGSLEVVDGCVLQNVKYINNLQTQFDDGGILEYTIPNSILYLTNAQLCGGNESTTPILTLSNQTMTIVETDGAGFINLLAPVALVYYVEMNTSAFLTMGSLVESSNVQNWVGDDGTCTLTYLYDASCSISLPFAITGSLTVNMIDQAINTLYNDSSTNLVPTPAVVGNPSVQEAIVALYNRGGGGVPAGSDTQVQYNNAGAFGANGGFTYNGSLVNVVTTLVAGALESTSVDAPASGALIVGGTNATSITVGQPTTDMTVISGATFEQNLTVDGTLLTPNIDYGSGVINIAPTEATGVNIGQGSLVTAINVGNSASTTTFTGAVAAPSVTLTSGGVAAGSIGGESNGVDIDAVLGAKKIYLGGSSSGAGSASQVLVYPNVFFNPGTTLYTDNIDANSGVLTIGSTNATSVNIGKNGNAVNIEGVLNIINNNSLFLDPNSTVDTSAGGSISFGAINATSLMFGKTGAAVGFVGTTPVLQQVAGVGSGVTFVSNVGTAVTTTSTFNGYTVSDIVKALQNFGLLA